MNVSLGEAAELMSDARTIVITAHVHPDGDAIGSSLGLMHFLRSQGKEVQVLIDDDIPAIFDILPGYELIEKPDPERRQSADLRSLRWITSKFPQRKPLWQQRGFTLTQEKEELN